jgi:hypothetical protein
MLLHSSISVQIERISVKFKIAPRKHESILNMFLANNPRPPNNVVSMPLSHCHDCLLCGTLPYTINSIIMSGIAPKQNAFKSIVKKQLAGIFPPPILVNGPRLMSRTSCEKMSYYVVLVSFWISYADLYKYPSRARSHAHTVPELLLCLCMLKHRGPLTRMGGGNIPANCFLTMDLKAFCKIFFGFRFSCGVLFHCPVDIAASCQLLIRHSYPQRTIKVTCTCK